VYEWVFYVLQNPIFWLALATKPSYYNVIYFFVDL